MTQTNPKKGLIEKNAPHLMFTMNEALSQFKTVTVTLSHVKIDCKRNNLFMFDSKRVSYDYCNGPDGNVFKTKNPGRITMQKTKSCSFCASPMSFTFTITLTSSGTVKQTTASSTSLVVQATSPMFPVSCGSPAVAPITTGLKIVGGITSRENSWPWQVLLIGAQNGLCAGSLVNSQVLIIFFNEIFYRKTGRAKKSEIDDACVKIFFIKDYYPP